MLAHVRMGVRMRERVSLNVIILPVSVQSPIVDLVHVSTARWRSSLFCGWNASTVKGGLPSTSTMASISTATPRGKALTPSAVLAWTPLSPKISANKSEAPLATFETGNQLFLVRREHTKPGVAYFGLLLKTVRALHHDVQLYNALHFTELPDLS